MATPYLFKPDDHHEHVRYLLEQRAIKADLHAHYPPDIDDHPDTPSVYTQYSPRSTSHGGEIDSPIHPISAPLSRHPRSHTLLDLEDSGDDEHSRSARENDGNAAAYHYDIDDQDNQPTLTLQRNLSIMGPKMKIHSPAPWETEWSDHPNRNAGGAAEEDDDDTKSVDARSLFSGRKRSKLRQKGEKALKAISLGSISPRFTRSSSSIPSPKSERRSGLTDENNISLVSRHHFPSSPVPPLPSDVAVAKQLTVLDSEGHSQPSPKPINDGIPYHKSQDVGNWPEHTETYQWQYRVQRHPRRDPSYSEDTADRYHPFANPDNLVFANRLSYIEATTSEVSSQTSSNLRYSSPSDSVTGVEGPRRTRSEHPPSSLNEDSTSPQSLLLSKPRPRTKSSGAIRERVIPHDLRSPGPRDQPHINQATAFPLELLGKPPSIESSTRVIKQKKSGLLRLFNKEKDKETDKRTFQGAPLASLSSTESSGIQSVRSTAEIPPVHTRPLRRVPVPQTDTHDSATAPEKRPPPLLSIHAANKDRPVLLSGDVTQPVPINGQLSYPSSAPATTANFPALSLRPVSTLFSDHFANHIIPSSPPTTLLAAYSSRSSIGSTSVTTPLTSPLPSTPNSKSAFTSITHSPRAGTNERDDVVLALREQLEASKQVWTSQIFELERQVRELRDEVDTLRSGEHCDACGRGGQSSLESRLGVLHRPRTGTGIRSRTLFGGGRED